MAQWWWLEHGGGAWWLVVTVHGSVVHGRGAAAIVVGSCTARGGVDRVHIYVAVLLVAVTVVVVVHAR